MTTPDHEEPAEGPRPYFLAIIAAIAAIFAAGFAVGTAIAGIDHGFRPQTWLSIFGGVAASAGLFWYAARQFAATRTGPLAPSVRQQRRLLALAGTIGGAIGLLLGTGLLFGRAGDVEITTVLNSPLPPLVAGIVILTYLAACLIITPLWLASVDEHELQANYVAAMAALYTYLVVEPVWWLAWRGGLAPELPRAIPFVLVITVYMAVWLWRRNR